YVYGYIIDFYNTPMHLWAEVYMENIGWVNFEVIPGNDAKFNSIQNKYICLSVVKNDDILRNGFYYGYTFWGDRIEHGNFFKLNWKK
ncbi:MAG: transglutaminase-like domain-containing protein, partial [Odoribacter sp.]|nr:transglutaminase-like domain-containing protein [Odoribacter sp.]